MREPLRLMFGALVQPPGLLLGGTVDWESLHVKESAPADACQGFCPSSGKPWTSSVGRLTGPTDCRDPHEKDKLQI